MLSKEEITRWVVIPISITSNNQIVKIDEKIPTNVKRCVGVRLSVKGIINTTVTSIPQFGEISLWMNNQKQHIIHEQLHYEKSPTFRKRSNPINQNIEAGSEINGYYKDNGKSLLVAVFQAYTVNLILECVTERNFKNNNICKNENNDTIC